MFPSDEKMTVLEMVRPAATKLGLETPLELWGFFVKQVRMGCMSRMGVLAHVCVRPQRPHCYKQDT